MSSLTSIKRSLDRLKAMIPSEEPCEVIDLSQLTEEEREQLFAIQASLPLNGTLKDVTDEQLAQLQRLALPISFVCRHQPITGGTNQ